MRDSKGLNGNLRSLKQSIKTDRKTAQCTRREDQEVEQGPRDDCAVIRAQQHPDVKGYDSEASAFIHSGKKDVFCTIVK